METLPREVKSKITSQVPLSSTMLLNRSYHQLDQPRYCESFEPTDTQILQYVEKAERFDIPYVKYELRYGYQTMLIYTYIADIHKTGVDSTVFYRYYVDDQGNSDYISFIVGKRYPVIGYHLTLPTLPIEIVYDHQYFDLDLFSLYQLYLDYCDVKMAKKLIGKKLDKLEAEYLNVIHNGYADQALVYQIFIYLTTSAHMVDIWTDDYKVYQANSSLFFKKVDIDSYDCDNEIEVTLYNFRKYFRL